MELTQVNGKHSCHVTIRRYTAWYVTSHLGQLSLLPVGSVAQRVERRTCDQQVVGSVPTRDKTA